MMLSPVGIGLVLALTVGIAHQPAEASAPRPFVVIQSQKGGCGPACNLAGAKLVSAEECAATCLATEGCKCAFYRHADGYCSMKRVRCESEAMAMSYDPDARNDAISLCDGRTWIPVKSVKGNCGPDCNGSGSARPGSLDLCATLCKEENSCKSAFFRLSDNFCSLKTHALDEPPLSASHDVKGRNDAVFMCPAPAGGSGVQGPPPPAEAMRPFVVIKSQKGGCGAACNMAGGRTASAEECAATCSATEGCKCAFYRHADGFCSMKRVRCESEAMAMSYDPEARNDAISLCDGRAWIPVKSVKGNCGPDCNGSGSAHSGSLDLCATRCKQESSCESAFFRVSDKYCSLKTRALDAPPLSASHDAEGRNDAVHMCPASAESCEYKQYSGIEPVCAGCRLPERDVFRKSSAAECEEWCARVGWAECRAVVYVPAAVSGERSGKCEVYNETLDALGPFGFTQREGVVTSSCGAPPPSQQLYPANPVADLGVAWEELCSGDAAYAVVPNQHPDCGWGCSLPAPEGKEESSEAHRVESLKECAADCLADEACQCAYVRHLEFNDRSSTWCLRHRFPCNSSYGATYDPMHAHRAILPCREPRPEPEAGAEPGFIDWFGYWDTCSAGINTYYYDDYEVGCGPDCQLGGVASVGTKEGTIRGCANRCRADDGCQCAVYDSVTKECRLMTTCDRRVSYGTTSVVIDFCCKEPGGACDEWYEQEYAY